MNRVGLRTRLAAALVGVAALAVGLATLMGNRGLEPRLEETAQARLQRSAAHFADVAATVRADVGSWPATRPTLAHLAALDDLRAELRVGGEVVRLNGRVSGPRATAPVIRSGRHVGTVTISPASGALYTPEEEQLRRSLDRLHLIAGGVAIAAALLVAFLLAATLTGPLRRLRQTAERMEQGEIDARVDARGAPELAAVGRALNRLSESLEHEEEIRKQTVADLAHELRTPVNGLLTRIEAAQDGVLEAPGNLEAMHQEAVRLTRLLDDLARLADAEQPGLLLEKSPLELAQVARATAESFAPRFAEAGTDFDVTAAFAWVNGNAGRLEQIISNLLSNALRYTERGGTVVLRVERAGDDVVLEVADTGAGIAPDDLRHIFTRFWRGDRSRSRATGGTGIGLAIVRELVRAHEGRIDVDSVLGHGSRFRVVLPAADRSEWVDDQAPALDRARR